MHERALKRVRDVVLRRKRSISLFGAALIVLLLAVWAAVSGCWFERGRAVAPPPLADEQLLVRVRLVQGAGRLAVAVDGPFLVLGERNSVLAESAGPLPETMLAREPAGTWRLGSQQFAVHRLEIRPRRDGTLRVNQRLYAGFIRALPGPGAGGLTAMNVVHLEDYVAGVVTAEMPASYPQEALKAQAVIARTYAAYEKFVRRDRDWDVTDDTSSQVYRGLEAARFGRPAADATRGLMLAYGPPGDERIFPTMYHSTCGGATVSIKHVKSFIAEIPPLAGGQRCDWCIGSAYRNWGPTRVAKSQLWPDLVRRNRQVPPDGLARNGRILEGRKDSAGRLIDVQVAWDGGTATMLADELRLAIGPSVMRSTLVQLADIGDWLVLTNGHGWGHGVGLCQVGAGAMARNGWHAGQILQYYYSGATIKKAYP